MKSALRSFFQLPQKHEFECAGRDMMTVFVRRHTSATEIASATVDFGADDLAKKNDAENHRAVLASVHLT